MSTQRWFDWALLLGLSLAWGFTFVLIAVALESFPPMTLVAIRLVTGALTLYVLMRWQGLRLPGDWAWWRRFATLAAIGNIVPFTLISWGELYISSSLAGILMALMPISVMILAHFFVANEHITLRKATGFVLGLVGVLVLVGAEALTGLGGMAVLAQLAIVGATLCYAVNSIITKRLPPIHVLVAATGTLVAGSVILTPIALLVDQPWQHAVYAGPLASVMVLGVLSTGLATWVYFLIVARRGPSFLSMINYIIPVVAFTAGVWLLGEPAALQKFIALGAIFAGIAIAQTRRPRPLTP